jgi:hypothetical protein
MQRLATGIAISSLALSAAIADTAHAFVAAGWDFSQYLGDGLLTIDGENGATTLAANYSNLDPTFNAGAESAAFGTMFINGQFGSSSVDPLGSQLEFVPSADPVQSNLDAPVQQPGDIAFNAFEVLREEGQTFQNDLSMIARDAVAVVFRADVSSAGESADGWHVTFGGKLSSGSQPTGSSVVTVEASLDGSDYAEVGTVAITAADTPYAMLLTTATSASVFVRFVFDPVPGEVEPLIDNVAIEVPEPGAIAQLAAACAALACLRRRLRS